MLTFGLLLTLAGCSGDAVDAPEKPLPELPPRAGEVPLRRGDSLPLREISIAWTGEVRGEIEPCGCPTLPFGGFVRRTELLRRLQGELDRPLLHVDAGETLRKGLVHAPGGETEERAGLILELLVLSGVQVYVPGPTDLATVGVEGLQRSGLTVVSATWEPFPATHVLEVEGLRVGFIGLSKASPLVPSRAPVEAARQALDQLEGVDLVVAVSNLDDADNLAVAGALPLVVLSTKGSAYDAPRQAERGVVLEVADRGRYVNVAHIQALSTPSQPFELEADFDFVRFDEHRRARARRGDELPSAEELALLSQLETLGAGRNLVSLEERPLGSELQSEKGPVAVRLAAWREERMSEARAAVRSEPEEFTPAYATAAACTSCHTKQFARFGFTEHKGAGVTLVTEGRQADPECLGCHTTGFGEPGGFAETSPAALRKWGGVQCEACHGPLAGHPGEERATPARVDESTCLRCHDEANSPNFDYDAYLLDVICPAG